MIYKFKLNDSIYNKLKNWSKDKSEFYGTRLAGNMENEFNLINYAKELEPHLVDIINDIEPLKKYFTGLDILYPNGLPLVLKSLWVNYQKKYEFNPLHNHGGLFSFIIFIKIPYTMAEQSAASPGRKSNFNVAGKLSFVYLDSDVNGSINTKEYDVDKTWEGFGLIFKSNLNHCVYPFYTDGERITISGNLQFNTKPITQNDKTK